MAQAEQGYNGWTNWETWNTALWIDNDEGMYRERRSYARGREWTEEMAEAFVRELMPNGTPDMGKGASRYATVDWQEIADAWNGEEDE